MEKTVRETKRADELKPGDWLIEDEEGDYGLNEVKAAFQYPTAHGMRVHLTTQTPGKNPYSAGNLALDFEFELATEAEVAALREQAERAQKIADIRALADWLEANPEVPLAAFPAEQVDLHDGAASVAFVRELGAKFGSKVRDDLDDRTQVYVKFGSFEYRVIAWHHDGRPAEPAPDPTDERDADAQQFLDAMHASADQVRQAFADPTGLAYTRADDEPDDPTPVSGARVEPHVGGMTDEGLVDETVHREYPVFAEDCWHGNTCPGTGPDCGPA